MRIRREIINWVVKPLIALELFACAPQGPPTPQPITDELVRAIIENCPPDSHGRTNLLAVDQYGHSLGECTTVNTYYDLGEINRRLFTIDIVDDQVKIVDAYANPDDDCNVEVITANQPPTVEQLEEEVQQAIYDCKIGAVHK